MLTTTPYKFTNSDGCPRNLGTRNRQILVAMPLDPHLHKKCEVMQVPAKMVDKHQVACNPFPFRFESSRR